VISLDDKIKIFVQGNLEIPKAFFETIGSISGFEEAEVIMTDKYIEDSRPVCVKSSSAFDIYYMNKISHVESLDLSLIVAFAFSLSHGFDASFIYRQRFRLMFTRMLQSFIINGEVEDRNGMSHSERVAKLVQRFGIHLGINGEELDKLVEYAMLHDVGKIGLEQIMLYSPTRIRNWLHNGHDHTVVGSIFLATTGILIDAAPIARSHHERWDGHGYPDKLRGEEIPYYARIIAICDFYDEALNTVSSEIAGRPLNETETLQMIKDQSGQMFDPSLAEKFLEMMDF
jgi:HD-GYP domain-containing protein (c-di-GMP phosphodiesterase class II)